MAMTSAMLCDIHIGNTSIEGITMQLEYQYIFIVLKWDCRFGTTFM
ncbi:MAG TPA: hypothetical protein VF476_18050 [Chitinophagaceae bacterium]